MLSCKSETGITIGLIDAMISISRVLAKRDFTDPDVMEALKDIREDHDVATIMGNKLPSNMLEQYCTTLQIPNKKIKNRVWISKDPKNDTWYIMTTFGPTWFWNEEKNDWVISIQANPVYTQFNTMAEAFEKAITLHPIRHST